MAKEEIPFHKTREGKQVAVKIYRLENCNFNKMYEYMWMMSLK